MTFGQDIDAMVEAHNGEEWERHCAYEHDILEAVAKLQASTEPLFQVIRKLHDAAEQMAGDPEEYRIESLAMQLENLSDLIEGQIRRMEREAV